MAVQLTIAIAVSPSTAVGAAADSLRVGKD